MCIYLSLRQMLEGMLFVLSTVWNAALLPHATAFPFGQEECQTH